MTHRFGAKGHPIRFRFLEINVINRSDMVANGGAFGVAVAVSALPLPLPTLPLNAAKGVCGSEGARG